MLAKTRAYGLGFNSVYLNLADELSRQLLAFTDPRNGRAVVRRVFRATPRTS